MVPVEARASIRVLVIDDDRILREGCASVLQVEGYNVVTSGRGDEAIELFRRSRFDIVLVDLYMTPVPGIEILKAVLEAQPSTIVIMMTGNPSVASSLEAMRIGAEVARRMQADDLEPLAFPAAHKKSAAFSRMRLLRRRQIHSRCQ